MNLLNGPYEVKNKPWQPHFRSGRGGVHASHYLSQYDSVNDSRLCAVERDPSGRQRRLSAISPVSLVSWSTLTAGRSDYTLRCVPRSADLVRVAEYLRTKSDVADTCSHLVLRDRPVSACTGS